MERDPAPAIVTSAWLSRHLEDVTVGDVRTSMFGGDAAAEFGASHITGARLVLLDEMLAGPPGGAGGRHPLPTPGAFAAVLGRLGIAEGDHVVAYDARGGAIAARFVWMLRLIGQPASLLDGGLAGWTGPTDVGPPDGNWRTVERREVPWPTAALADADEVVAHIAAGGVVIDSRERARYLGETEPIDPVAGHVPGAVNIPFAGNLGESGHFGSTVELAERFRRAAGDPSAIVYCGSGVTACHNALAMEAAGLPRPRVYVGSWSGWSADPTRPVATGPDP